MLLFKHTILLSLCLISFFNCGAIGNNDRLHDQVFDPAIKTVQFGNFTSMGGDAIMLLGGTDFLSLSFDKMGTEKQNFRYTIKHCNSDWTLSNLIQTQYIDGMFTDDIMNVSYSSHTYKNYVHYALDFPSQSVKPKISGNYLLVVYLENVDEPSFIKRFYVYENMATVNLTPKRPTHATEADTKQEIDFSVRLDFLNVPDPFNDLKVVLKQNWRWDNEIYGLKPQYVRDKELSYDYDEENLFDAGTEFRPFDIRNTKYRSIGVRFFSFDTAVVANLYPDDDRSYLAFTKNIDQDGKYVIQTKQGNSNETEGDYIWVHFSFRPAYGDQNINDLYVFGALTNWNVDENFKMIYNSINNIYECYALVKQGFYDYQYISVSETGIVSSTKYEGSHWETENYYTALVYYRSRDLDADKLVGVMRSSFNGLR